MQRRPSFTSTAQPTPRCARRAIRRAKATPGAKPRAKVKPRVAAAVVAVAAMAVGKVAVAVALVVRTVDVKIFGLNNAGKFLASITPARDSFQSAKTCP